MFERFTKEARAVTQTAERLARARGDRTIEAEHLLLACDLPDLDPGTVEVLLEREEEQALAAVGVSRTDFDLPPRRRRGTAPSFGRSAKVALQRALVSARDAGDRRIGRRHVALGVLGAQDGRVPRALRIGDIDVDALRNVLSD